MPKLFNTNIIAVLLATITFFMFGWIWYGLLFEDVWLAAEGITQEVASQHLEEIGMVTWLVSALLLTLGQAVGVLMVIHHVGAKKLPACLKAAFWLAVTIPLPLLANGSVYDGYPLSGFLIDASHILIGYLLMAEIYAAFRGKGAVDGA